MRRQYGGRLITPPTSAPRDPHAQRDDGHGWEHVDTAFRPGRAATPYQAARRVTGKQVSARHLAAVGNSIEIRLRPIPTSVQSHRPVKRSGPYAGQLEWHDASPAMKTSLGDLYARSQTRMHDRKERGRYSASRRPCAIRCHGGFGSQEDISSSLSYGPAWSPACARPL
jgi:hypothetical protein